MYTNGFVLIKFFPVLTERDLLSLSDEAMDTRALLCFLQFKFATSKEAFEYFILSNHMFLSSTFYCKMFKVCDFKSYDFVKVFKRSFYLASPFSR